MVDPTYPLFPIFAFLGFTLTLVPLSWHLEAWNSATCYYMMWSSLACLNQLVNSVVWAKDAIDHAPIWCDICEFPAMSCSGRILSQGRAATRITIAASVGIPAASMCINQRLYGIARVHAVMITRSEVSSNVPVYQHNYSRHTQKRRAVMIDTLICVLFPIIVVALCKSDSQLDLVHLC